MGIVILPFFLGAIVLFLLSILDASKMIKRKELLPDDFKYGFGVAAVIYIVFFCIYCSDDSAYTLSPFFIMPAIMVYLPYFLVLFTKNSQNLRLNIFSKYLVLSICILGICAILFNSYFLGIIDFLGLKTHH
jgi:hypothetical protein